MFELHQHSDIATADLPEAYHDRVIIVRIAEPGSFLTIQHRRKAWPITPVEIPSLVRSFTIYVHDDLRLVALEIAAQLFYTAYLQRVQVTF